MTEPQAMNDVRPRTGDALLVVDVQRDFFSGGALAVPEAEQILPAVNRLIERFRDQGFPIVATQDLHPADHCSFIGSGGRWPTHCVEGTAGAEPVAELKLPEDAIRIRKGVNRDQEAYSAFSGTSLREQLQQLGIERVFVCGVATEYCVAETAKDALSLGLEVVLLGDCVRAVDARAGQRAIADLLSRGVLLHQPSARDIARPGVGALMTDLYQLTMLQGYFYQRMNQTAVFEFFIRKLPKGRNFLVAAGLEQVLEYLEGLRFTPDELEWLAGSGFHEDFVRHLETFRFTGDVQALPEGTVFFPDEPMIRVTAPLPEAQLVESRIINILHFQTLIASKAARSVLVAPDKLLVDFGMRRAHAAEAGLWAARAAYAVGFAGSATVEAGRLFGVPLYGTMAHSFIQAHDVESEAFEHFALANPNNVVFLIDTYDTERAAEKVVQLSSRLKARGIPIKSVRLDSGDLAEHARRVRRILDSGDLSQVKIFVSGGLDEYDVSDLIASGAPIDGFGIGTRLDVSADAPALDCAYKLQEYAGRPRRKRSEGKATWPGRKQVFRTFERGVMSGDVVALENEPERGEPLLQYVMRGGARVEPAQSMTDIRQRAAANLAALPPALKDINQSATYPVAISQAIREMASALDSAHEGG